MLLSTSTMYNTGRGDGSLGIAASFTIKTYPAPEVASCPTGFGNDTVLDDRPIVYSPRCMHTKPIVLQTMIIINIAMQVGVVAAWAL